MKTSLITAVIAIIALWLTSCTTVTTYSAKGTPVQTVKRPDTAFWGGAAKLAGGYVISQSSSK